MDFRPSAPLSALICLLFLSGCQTIGTDNSAALSLFERDAEPAQADGSASSAGSGSHSGGEPDIADPVSEDAAVEPTAHELSLTVIPLSAPPAPPRHKTASVIPLSAYQPKSLPPVPDYAVDHISSDIAKLFPETYNADTAYEWPRRMAQYERDIWHDLRSRFRLDHSVDDPRIDAEIRWYSRNQGYFNRVAQRARRYLPHVLAEIEKRNLPGELALVPVIESAYDPFAYSHGRASGMWQFIPGTGRQYGLHQDWWYDGRRDVWAATDAALDYYEDLSGMFDGDWELAMASYNAGPGNVLSAQRANRRNGLPLDFWNLALPRETRLYVPKIMALARIISDPKAYGLELPIVPNEPYFERVELDGQIDLAQAARMADMSLEDLYLLNPGYNRWATHPEVAQYLLIPVDKAESFRRELRNLPADQRMAWQRYQIESGDSLLSISRQFQTTVDVLRDVNDIAGNTIRAGEHLLIPTASARDSAYSLSAGNRLDRQQSRQPGEGLQRTRYTVQPGDSFWEIARRHDVNVRALARWNGKAPTDPIMIGEELVIWLEPGQQMANQSSGAPASRSVVRRVGYTVRNGDSLHRIADRFNVSVNDIQRWNSSRLGGDYIHPGLYLELFVDVTNGPF